MDGGNSCSDVIFYLKCSDVRIEIFFSARSEKCDVRSLSVTVDIPGDIARKQYQIGCVRFSADASSRNGRISERKDLSLHCSCCGIRFGNTCVHFNCFDSEDVWNTVHSILCITTTDRLTMNYGEELWRCLKISPSLTELKPIWLVL